MFEKHPLTKRPLPRDKNEKEIVIINDFAEFNDANVSFETQKDYEQWDLEAVAKQAQDEKKESGIYIYNVFKKQFVAYTRMNKEQLIRTCRYFGIKVPNISTSNKPTFDPDKVLIQYEYF